MGALDYLSNFCTFTTTRTKRKAMQILMFICSEIPLLALVSAEAGASRRVTVTVEIKVKMDCDGCERRIKNAVTSMKGVKNVEVNRKQSRVVVSGYVEPNKVLKRIKRIGKRAEFWPYIPQHLVYYPYVAGAYDKRAPAGHVRNVVQAFPATTAPEDNMISIFSDDNVHACSIM